jgi:hypothetical protein
MRPIAWASTTSTELGGWWPPAAVHPHRRRSGLSCPRSPRGESWTAVAWRPSLEDASETRWAALRGAIAVTAAMLLRLGAVDRGADSLIGSTVTQDSSDRRSRGKPQGNRRRPRLHHIRQEHRPSSTCRHHMPHQGRSTRSPANTRSRHRHPASKCRPCSRKGFVLRTHSRTPARPLRWRMTCTPAGPLQGHTGIRGRRSVTRPQRERFLEFRTVRFSRHIAHSAYCNQPAEE